MKKLINSLTLILAVVFVFVNLSTVKGENNVKATLTPDGVITVEGNIENALAVAVVIYDSSEENILIMKTGQVLNDGTYSVTFDEKKFEKGDYIVKAADYEGGTFAKTNVVFIENAKEEKLPEKETGKSVSTGDSSNVMLLVGIMLAAMSGFGLVIKKKQA